MNAIDVSKELLQFIDESPTPFHAVANAEAMLKEAGFEKLVDQQIVAGGKYQETRNSSSIIAFQIPENGFEGFRVGANYALAKNIVAQVEYYDLEAREGAKEEETLWTQVTFTF